MRPEIFFLILRWCALFILISASYVAYRRYKDPMFHHPTFGHGYFEVFLAFIQGFLLAVVICVVACIVMIMFGFVIGVLPP